MRAQHAHYGSNAKGHLGEFIYLCITKARAKEDLQIFIQGPLNGGRFKRGGFSRSGLFCPFLSFFVLFCPFLSFPDFSENFPDLLEDGPGIFPIRPFSLSRPIKSTHEEQSRKGPRHNLDLSRKKWENPPVWKPPALASLNSFVIVSRADGTAVPEGHRRKRARRVLRGVLWATWLGVPENVLWGLKGEV